MNLPDIDRLERITPYGTELGLACWKRAAWGSNALDPRPPEKGDFDDVDLLWVFLYGVVCIAIGAIVAAGLTGL